MKIEYFVRWESKTTGRAGRHEGVIRDTSDPEAVERARLGMERMCVWSKQRYPFIDYRVDNRIIESN